METVQQMAKFACLSYLVHLELNEQEDQILWRWIEDVIYTLKSAYLARFKGFFCSIKAKSIWRERAEGKLKFFACC